MIEVLDISKVYGEHMVLKNITLSLESGKIHGIIGRNGSGKTVLFKIICGITKPTCGQVLINGQSIGKDLEVPPSLGAIINTPGFIPHMSGRQNLELLAGLKLGNKPQVIRTVMERVGLDPDLHTHVGKYSMGMLQRLGIAQAIMEDPELLILDEPMNGLDKQGVEDMRTLFKQLRNEGKTILLASHNQADIDRMCDTVYEIDSGEVSRIC